MTEAKPITEGELQQIEAYIELSPSQGVRVEAMARLVAEVRRLRGPFTCGHPSEHAGGACAVCHATWIEKAENLQRMLDAANEREQIQLRQAVAAVKARNEIRELADAYRAALKEIDHLVPALPEKTGGCWGCDTFSAIVKPALELEADPKPAPMCQAPHPLEKIVDETLEGGTPT